VPSQTPVVPHVDAGIIAQSLFGLRPAATLPQVPSAPWPFIAALQAVHTPVQAVLQHTPSTQKPLVHSVPAVQAVPRPWRVVVVVVLAAVVLVVLAAVVLVVLAAVVVVVVTISGAHTIFGVLGVSCRSPNWSCH